MHIIKVCTGCSCEKSFSSDVLKRAEKVLDIKVGQTTSDGKFRLEKTRCLSQCEKAPAVMICEADGPLSELMNTGEVKTRFFPSRLEAEITRLKNDT
jgi:predicted metal-binding protein